MIKTQEFKSLYTPSRWLKIFWCILTAVFLTGVVANFALIYWADEKVETAQLSFVGVDKAASNANFVDKFAYTARVHFPRLDVLLRSKVIARIDIDKITYNPSINANLIISTKSQNRYIKFITSQNLTNLNIQDLGTVTYKMDFSPFLYTLLKYYLMIGILAYIINILHKSQKDNINQQISEKSLPQMLYQGYLNIAPLYRQSFWIVFIALNIVFGFHTLSFLWGNHDWAAVFYRYGITSEIYMGRYTQNLISLFLQDGMMLPLLNNILAFLGFALASVWLCMYFNIQKRLYIWLIVSFVLTLQPFTFTRLYYAFQVAGLFIAIAIGILGFVLAKKAGEFSSNKMIYGGGGLII